LIRVLTPNFNIVDLIKVLEKKSKTLQLDLSGHIEDGIMQNHEKKKRKKKEEVKKVKNQDFMGKTNFFLSTVPFNRWAVSATWLHVGAPHKIHEK
jgi:hypothetical protein